MEDRYFTHLRNQDRRREQQHGMVNQKLEEVATSMTAKETMVEEKNAYRPSLEEGASHKKVEHISTGLQNKRRRKGHHKYKTRVIDFCTLKISKTGQLSHNQEMVEGHKVSTHHEVLHHLE